MYTIKNNTEYIYEIKKSKFISLIYKINSYSDIEKYLNEIKNKYKDATHYCYAYKIENTQKYSDDGEPGGTAGLPIMEVINKKNLDYILCVVVRYFGGIKLGAGGLVRAYTLSVSNAINDNIIELIPGYLVKIEIEYDKQKQLDYILKNMNIKKEFNTLITYYIEISKENIKLINNYNYQILKNIMIKNN